MDAAETALFYVRLEAKAAVRLAVPHFCARCSPLPLSLGVAEWIFALSEAWTGTPQVTLTGSPSSGGSSYRCILATPDADLLEAISGPRKAAVLTDSDSAARGRWQIRAEGRLRKAHGEIRPR